MNDQLNRKCLKFSLVVLGIIISCILFYTTIKNFSNVLLFIRNFLSVFGTIFLGLSFAYIINPLIMYFKGLLSKLSKQKNNSKAVRFFSVFLSYVLVLIILCAFIWYLIPSLVTNIGFFVSNFSSYLGKFRVFFKNISMNLPFGQTIFNEFNEFIIKFAENFTSWLSINFAKIITVLYATTDAVTNFIVAFIISIYMSFSKEHLIAQLKKLILAVFPRDFCDKTMVLFRIINQSFSGYVSCVFISSAIIGALCLLCMSIFGLQYAPLISFIVMLTDIIPYFGPFIGAAIGTILLLLVNPTDAFWFLIIILVLQQVTSYVINPKIIGKTTGLSSIFVIMSVIIMGDLFGVIGMIIAVPVFVVLLRIIEYFIEIKQKEQSNEKST
ncbi:MAG: AI-2E family transporter [Clostridia bacterium]|nr:AI-2E family transporter [Clostridia bacterium]